MARRPDRTRPSSSDEDVAIERRAAEGRARIAAEQKSSRTLADRDDAARRETCLRQALGLHYGSPARRSILAIVFALGVAALGVPLVLTASNTIAPKAGQALPEVGVVILLAGFWLIFMTPMASKERVEAERRWVASLPFALKGYLEALSEPPKIECHLCSDTAWISSDRAPTAETVRGLVGMIDAKVEVVPCDGGLRIRSGPLSGEDWRSSTRGRYARGEYFNHRHVAYVHDLVEKVLVPLHGSYPVAAARIHRDR